MKNLLRFVVTGLLLGWVGWKTDWHAVRVAFANLKHGYWLAAVGLLVVTQVVSALRWRIFARQLGIDRPLTQLTRFSFIGMYFNLLLPTSVGGDVVRAWYLNGSSGRKLRAVASVLLDRISGLIVLMILACTAVMASPRELPSWIPLFAYTSSAGTAAVLVGAFAVSRTRFMPARYAEQARLMWELVREPRSLVASTFLSAYVQAANVGIVWLVGEGLGASIPLGYYAIFVPLVSLLTLMPVSVNGMGVREWGVTFFLDPLGVPNATSVTLAFLWFAVHLTVSAMGGLVYAFGGTARPLTGGTDKDGETAKDGDHGPVDRDSDQGREGQHRRAA